ncbi:hypothetical protein Hanom_Chr12g01160231 [Helianthus anomalus]
MLDCVFKLSGDDGVDETTSSNLQQTPELFFPSSSALFLSLSITLFSLYLHYPFSLYVFVFSL